MRKDLAPHVYIQPSSNGFLVSVGLIPSTIPLSDDAIRLKGRHYRSIMALPVIAQVEYTTLVNPAGKVCGYAIWGAHGFLPLMNRLFQSTPGFSVNGDYACFLLNRACGQWRIDESSSDFFFQLWANGPSTVLEIVEFPARWDNIAYDFTLLRDDELVRSP